jgi:hypothetical protein
MKSDNILRRAVIILGITAMVFAVGVFAAAHVSAAYAEMVFFPDVQVDNPPLFYPHIKRFFDGNFVKGYENTGKFEPKNFINRAGG